MTCPVKSSFALRMVLVLLTYPTVYLEDLFKYFLEAD